jgi:hypothetical protein
MKNKITLLILCFCLVTTTGFSQKTVNASDIIKDIKDGKNVSIKNATVIGTLDFTFMEEKLSKLPKKRKWWKNGGNNTVKNLIETKISFVNVTFEDDVLAYIPTENHNGNWNSKGGYTFVANFDDDAIFKNCVFERKAMFKYSKFDRKASFEGSKFKEDNTFKYAEFETKVNFSNTVFSETATFKYTKFSDGVSFNNAKFEEDLNIKYTKVSGDFDITGMKVAYDINSKYTKINGRSFTKYLVENR